MSISFSKDFRKRNLEFFDVALKIKNWEKRRPGVSGGHCDVAGCGCCALGVSPLFSSGLFAV
jgi:hypothetical protein